MNTLNRILILENEKLNADRLQRLILKVRPQTEILGVLSSVKKAENWLNEHESPDLIMMDIQLSDGLSFELFNRVAISCPVIFTTAHDEYAIKAFKYNSIDYLLKPIEEEPLAAALVKFEQSKQQSQTPLLEKLMAQMLPKSYRTRFLLPFRDGYRKINVEDIAFFYSHLNINYAHLFKEEEVVVPQTLETLEQELDPKEFFRVNRQYIVHVNAIEKVHNYFNGKLKLQLKNCNDDEILVSRTKAPLFKTWLDY